MDISLPEGRRPYQLDESPVLGIGGTASEATLRLIERLLTQQKKNAPPIEDRVVTNVPGADDDLVRATWEDAEWR